MGARPGVRDLGDRAGVGTAGAHRVGPRRGRPPPARVGHRPRRRVVVVLLRRGRDRQVDLPEGSVRLVDPRLSVRVDEPRVGARARPVGADRLAVRAGRIRRRPRDDRAHGAPPSPLRLAPARGVGPPARAGGRHAATSTTRSASRFLCASGSRAHRPGRTSPTTSAATGRCCGRRSPSASCWPGSSASWATTSSTRSS